MNIAAIVVSALVVTTGTVHAMPKEGCGGECSGCHSLTVKEADTLLKPLGGDVKQVKIPPVRGLWEVVLEKDGKKAVAYMDYGKKYVIPGAIYSLATRQPISGDSPAPPKVEKADIATIPVADSIVMGNPKGRTKLFVFTDPDCPFCAKLHGELKKLVAMNRDVTVYVKMFPLKMHPKAYDRARVILQRSSSKLLDDAFSGVPLPPPGPKTSRKGVDETIRLAKTLGITSTPTLVLPDGRIIPGFRDADSIWKLLTETKKRRG